MARQYCVNCDSMLTGADRFCPACGAARVDSPASSTGDTEGKQDVVEGSSDPQLKPTVHARRTPLIMVGALLAVVAVGGAVWFSLLRSAPHTSAQEEQQTLDGLVAQMTQAQSLTEVSGVAGTAKDRADNLSSISYTDSEEDQRLRGIDSLYAALASLQGASAKNPAVWDENKQKIAEALEAVRALPGDPPVTADEAEALVRNLTEVTASAKEHARKQESLDKVQAVAYEFKRKRDALNPYFTTTNSGRDMYDALQNSPARWKAMQTELGAIDVSRAPGIAAARDELNAALARGRTGITNFLDSVPNSYDCDYGCWRSVWDSTAGMYSKRNDHAVKHLLEQRLPRLQNQLRQTAR